MNKIKILFDAKWLYKGPTSGRVVVNSYVKYLENYTLDYEITLLIDSKDPNKDSYLKKGFKILPLYNFSLISNFLLYPLMYGRQFYDYGIFQNSVPLFFRGRVYQFIHDCIYESNPDFFTISERLLFSLIKLSNKFTDYVITISENEKKRLIKYKYGIPENMYVIHNGANHLETNVNNNLKYVNYDWIKDDYCLYVGRINERKNIKRLIKAFEGIENLKLVIVGSKDGLSNLKVNVNKNIIFTGFIDDATLNVVYKKAKFFVYVSIEEGFGLPPIEAMNHQLPVLVSNTSCFPEICKDAALYVDPFSVQSIRNGIVSMNSNDKMRQELIQKGNDVAQLYKWELSVSKLIHVLTHN